MRAKKNRFLQDKAAAASVEYALFAGMISLAAIPAVGTLGDKMTGTFNKVSVAIDAASPTTPTPPGGGGDGPGPMGRSAPPTQ
jgi:pilus assembly protein Flp/PilA